MIPAALAALGLLRSPLGAAGAALALALGWALLIHGPSERAAGAAGVEARVAAEVARQAAVQRAALDRAEDELAAARSEAVSRRAEADALRAVVRDACPLTAETLRRLEAIR